MLEETKQSKIALLLGLVLTTFITIIKAGSLPWVALLWVCLCAISLCVILIVDSKHPNVQTFKRSVFQPAMFFIAFQFWAIIQYFFISQDKSASLNQIFIGLGLTFLLAIWGYASRHPNVHRTLFNTIIFFTLIQSIYGLWVYLGDTNLLLWMPKLYYLDRPTGFFVNANHFAAYLVLTIILILSNRIAQKSPRTNKSTFFKVFDYLYSPSNLILCLLIITLIASRSVGAIVSLGLIVCIISFNLIRLSKQRKLILFGVAVFSCLILLFVLMLDYSLIESEMAGLSHTFSRRYALSQAAFSMLKDTWLLGVGGGSFYSQFSSFRTLEIGNTYYNYAHNDLLQFWIEYGLIGVTLLLCFIITIVRDNMRVMRNPHSEMHLTFAYASIFSTLAIMLHSLVDFPLHIPGYTACYLVIISINSLSFIGSKCSFDDDSNSE